MNILHGQWSSPTYAVLGGVPQVMFAGGDGYLYSFLGKVTPGGKAEMLWKFDANPKESKYILGGRGTRNEIIATPVVYDDKVYLAVGQDPEHGEGPGHLWCIDPTKRGDVSSELAFNVKDLSKPIPHKRLQAGRPDGGRSRPAEPELGRGLALRRVRSRRQRQDRIRRDDAPHLRQRRDQGRPAVPVRTSAACSTA